MDFVYALRINSRFAAKSTGVVSIGFRALGSVAVLLIFIPLRTCCGEPARSAAFCLELAVEEFVTVCRGLELRSGGEVFGGGADM